MFYNNPYFWILLTALFCGAALGRITTFTRKARDPQRARNRKWVLACIYFSVAMIMLVCAIFIPGPEKFLDLNLLFTFLGASLIFFLAFRFKKAFGLPFFLLFILFLVMVLLFLQSITAFTGETQIATVEVLELKDSRMKLEVFRDKDTPYQSDILELEGQFFALEANLVIFDDELVFFGAKTWYRLLGLRSYSIAEAGEMHTESGVYPFPAPSGISRQLYVFIQRNASRLPGIKTVQTEQVRVEAHKAATYLVLLQNDGGMEILEK